MRYLCLAVLAIMAAPVFAQQPPTLTQEQAIKLIQGLQPGERREIILTDENAVGVGAGLEANGQDVNIKDFDASSPEASTGKSKSKGGSTSMSIDLQSGSMGQVSLFVLGALCLIAAAACVYFRLVHAAICAGAAGILLLAIAFFPGLLVWGLLGGVAVLVGYVIYTNKTGRTYKEAARAVVGGVASAPQYVQDAVKAEIKKQADASDKAAIARIKYEDGLK